MAYLGKASKLFGALLLAGAGIAGAQCDKPLPGSVGNTLRVYRVDSDVIMNWQALPEAEFYRVYRDTNFASTYNPEITGDSPTTDWTDTGAAENGIALHKYKVEAANCAGIRIMSTLYRYFKPAPEQPEFAVRMGKEYLIEFESANDNGLPGHCGDLCGFPQAGMPPETCSGPPNPAGSGCQSYPPLVDFVSGLRVLNTLTDVGVAEIQTIADADGIAQMHNGDCNPGAPPCNWVDRSCPVQDNAGCASIVVYEKP
ncbi:MAG: hypothetical protein HYW25_01840 [Candidatus Aenigmarchaeota archaeon]|nr:hypothetical protein [Candidatus Aenigmarchaeota archaeon]